GGLSMRKALTLAAVVVLLAAAVLLALIAGIAAADAGTPSKATVPVDAHHAALLNRPPIIVTDAHHAVLVIRAGYRVRIAQPSIAKDPPAAMPSSDFAGLEQLISIRVVVTALLGVGAGVLALGLRRILEPRSE